MNRVYGTFVFALSLFFSCPQAIAGNHAAATVSPELEKIKQLVGTWQGVAADMGEGKIEVNYKLTSAGSAVVETISPGTPNEMTTVYYDEDGKLALSHYCGMGNHPQMFLRKTSANEYYFSADANGPLKDKAHMNSLAITFAGPNSIEHKWTMVDPGKPGHTTAFKLDRAK